MKNAIAKAVKWAKENPLTARDTGVADALIFARKWRSERDRLIRAIGKMQYACRDHEIAKIKGLAARFEKPRTGSDAIGQAP